MALGTNPSAHVGCMVSIPITHHAQITADDTGGTTFTMPFKGRLISAVGTVEAIGGTTVFTDVDLVVKNGTKSETLCTLAAVDASAIVSGGGTSGPASAGVADFEEGDVMELEIDITGGGGSPTADGITVVLYCMRE